MEDININLGQDAPEADLNQDGLVNADDIDVFTQNYGFDGNTDS